MENRAYLESVRDKLPGYQLAYVNLRMRVPGVR
jgi:hypothetical protein